MTTTVLLLKNRFYLIYRLYIQIVIKNSKCIIYRCSKNKTSETSGARLMFDLNWVIFTKNKFLTF